MHSPSKSPYLQDPPRANALREQVEELSMCPRDTDVRQPGVGAMLECRFEHLGSVLGWVEKERVVIFLGAEPIVEGDRRLVFEVGELGGHFFV